MTPISNSNIPAKVTVGTTATNLLDLIGSSNVSMQSINGIECYADGGDVRYTMSSDHTPDASTGFVLADTQTRIFEGLNLKDIKFYAGTDTPLQIQLLS